MNEDITSFLIQNPLYLLIFVLVTTWTLFWKGTALWRAATQGQRNWFILFILLFPINLFGIVELVFLFRFSTKKLTYREIKGWFGH